MYCIFLYFPVFTSLSHLIGRRNPSAYKKESGGEGHFSHCIAPHAESDPDSAMQLGGIASDTPQEANVGFDDAHTGFVDERGIVQDPLRATLEDDKISLDKFFARPIKYVPPSGTVLWEMGGGINQVQFNPWSYYFEDKRVINRIANYKLMKANLHVKFVVNGNSFYYGRELVSYRPLHTLDNTTILVPGNFADLVEASQRMHLYLNPTLSQGGTLTLPYFTPLNMLDIPNQDWQTMGVIDFSSLSPLKHANDANADISVNIFIWATDVELTGLTQQNPTNIVPQGMEDGIVSKPASTVAKIASLFTSVPYIGGFATATQIGARAIASMAAIFGYSKPTNNEMTYMTPTAYSSLALCDGKQNLLRLTVDSMNELTVDPRAAGIDMPDEMTILSIANRESLLTKFDWALGVTSETLLFNIIVDPCVVRQVGVGADAPIHMPACAFATFPFEYWKGSMRYRFQIVSSGFHKGRLKFVYDPFGVPQSGGLATPAEYNVAYTQIVDIAECPDFTIDVGWGQSTPFRRHLNTPQILGNSFAGASGSSPAVPLGLNSSNTIGVANGTLSVYVVNELTVPNTVADNDIEVLVSISALDDFEVAAPTDYYIRKLAQSPEIAPQGMIEPQGDEQMLSLESPVDEPMNLNFLGSHTVVDPLINKIHFGESIASFRMLLKRFHLHELLRITGTGNPMNRFHRRMFPYYGGYTGASNSDSNLIVNIAGTRNYAYATNTLMNYLTPAFGAWRGAIRYSVDASYFQGANWPCTFSVAREGLMDLNTTSQNVDQDDVTNLPATNELYNAYLNLGEASLGLNGLARWNSVVNPQATFEIPFYSRFRFYPARRRQLWTSVDTYQETFDIVTQSSSIGSDLAFALKYVAAGEDFSLYFYLSPPVVFDQEPPPLP